MIKAKSEHLSELAAFCAYGGGVAIWIYSIFHWDSAKFIKNKYRGIWNGVVVLGLALGGIVYYIVVCELEVGLKKDGEYYIE